MLKYAVFSISTVLVIWFLYWTEKAEQQEKKIRSWIENISSAEFSSEYTLSTKGFPYRIDTSIKKLKFFTANGVLIAHANEVLILSLIYNLEKTVFTLGNPIELNIGNLKLRTKEGTTRSSLKRSKDTVATFVLHSKDLKIQIGKDKYINIENLIIALRPSLVAKDIKTKAEVFVKLDSLVEVDDRLSDDLINKKKMDDNVIYGSERFLKAISNFGTRIHVLHPKDRLWISKATFQLVNSHVELISDFENLLDDLVGTLGFSKTK